MGHACTEPGGAACCGRGWTLMFSSQAQYRRGNGGPRTNRICTGSKRPICRSGYLILPAAPPCGCMIPLADTKPGKPIVERSPGMPCIHTSVQRALTRATQVRAIWRKMRSDTGRVIYVCMSDTAGIGCISAANIHVMGYMDRLTPQALVML